MHLLRFGSARRLPNFVSRVGVLFQPALKLNAALQAAGIGPAQLPASVKKRLSNVVDCAELVGCEGDFTLDEYSFLFLLSVFQGSFWPVQCGIMLWAMHETNKTLNVAVNPRYRALRDKPHMKRVPVVLCCPDANN